MSEWLRNPHVQEAIRTIVIAVLVAVLGLLGYDAQIAQPRITALEAEHGSMTAAMAPASTSDRAAKATQAFTITIRCDGGVCHGDAVASD